MLGSLKKDLLMNGATLSKNHSKIIMHDARAHVYDIDEAFIQDRPERKQFLLLT